MQPEMYILTNEIRITDVDPKALLVLRVLVEVMINLELCIFYSRVRTHLTNVKHLTQAMIK